MMAGSFLFGWFRALWRSILLISSELLAGDLVIELSEFLILFNVSGGLVGKRSNELVDLK